MTTLFSTSYLDSARTEAQMKANVLHNLRSVIQELPGGNEDIPALTISSGSVTPTAAIHTVDTEGAAASDTLSNIATTNMAEGRLLLFHIANGARLVTVEHEGGGAGQITLADSADLLMGETTHWLLLVCDGTDWSEVARFGYDIGPEMWGVKCLSGCVPTNDTDADHDVNISAGYHVLTDGSGNYKLFHLASGLCKQIDAAWSAGDDAGGFPSGLSLSASAMYYKLLIGKDDGTVDAGFDTAAAGTNLLADATDYTWYGILHGNFVVFTDGSSNIRGFNVVGDKIVFSAGVLDVNDSTVASGVAETGTLSAPPGSEAGVFAAASADGSVGQMTLEINDTAGQRYIVYAGYTSGNLGFVGAPATVFVDASRQVDYELTVSAQTPDSVLIYTHWFTLSA